MTIERLIAYLKYKKIPKEIIVKAVFLIEWKYVLVNKKRLFNSFNWVKKNGYFDIKYKKKLNILNKEPLEKIRLECIKKWKSSVNQTQNYKEIAERHGFNIWSSNGNAGFTGNNPSARIESIYVGCLNMDDILASSEDEAVKVAYDFIMSELIKNDFICNYQQDKNYAQKLFLKYVEGRSK